MDLLTTRPGAFKICCIAIAVTLASPFSVFGQLAANDQAHVMFDIRADQLRAFADSTGLLPPAESREYADPETKLLLSLTRVSGSIELPTDKETFQAFMETMSGGMGGPPGEFDGPVEKGDFSAPKAEKAADKSPGLSTGPTRRNNRYLLASQSGANDLVHTKKELGLNFLVKLTFVDKASCDNFMDELRFPEMDGNDRILKVPAGRDSDEIAIEVIARKKDDTSVELGTRTWLDHSSRNFGTERLKTMWREMPDQAIRIVADLQPSSELIGQLVEMGKAEAPGAAAGFLNLATLPESIRIGADPEKSPMCALILGCADETRAEELRAGLDGLLGMLKLLGGQGAEAISEVSPEASELVGDIWAALAAKREGNQVSIEIARPEGFSETIARLAKSVRKRADEFKALNDFRQIALSMHNFYDAYKRLPPPRPREEGIRQASWRVYVTPFLEEFPLYDRYRDDKDWNAVENQPLAELMPRLYGADGRNANICRISNGGNTPTKFEEVVDGLSNTIMLIEYPAGVPWMEPRDLEIDQALELVTALKEGESLRVALYDGSVGSLKSGLTAEQIRPFFTWDGGEVTDPSVIFGD
jgi:Protein of unknown function (DUF1559)